MARKNKITRTESTAYSQEFRDTAVELALKADKTSAAVAAELGIPARKLYDWIKAWRLKHKEEGSKSAATNDKVHALEKRIKQLEQENEILKKASAYFAKSLL